MVSYEETEFRRAMELTKVLGWWCQSPVSYASKTKNDTLDPYSSFLIRDDARK
jgi:hypothetical protein